VSAVAAGLARTEPLEGLEQAVVLGYRHPHRRCFLP
jgi:hypothetical protein